MEGGKEGIRPVLTERQVVGRLSVLRLGNMMNVLCQTDPRILESIVGTVAGFRLEQHPKILVTEDFQRVQETNVSRWRYVPFDDRGKNVAQTFYLNLATDMATSLKREEPACTLWAMGSLATGQITFPVASLLPVPEGFMHDTRTGLWVNRDDRRQYLDHEIDLDLAISGPKNRYLSAYQHVRERLQQIGKPLPSELAFNVRESLPVYQENEVSEGLVRLRLTE